MKFFEVIPSGTNFPFLKNRWKFITVSILMVVGSILALAWRQVGTGSALNFGIDFAGGSQVQIALREDANIPVDEIRSALEELGYEGSSAVTVPDKANEVLIRVKEVVSIDEATLAGCESAVAEVSGAKLVAFSQPDGGSKLFLDFDREPDLREIERVLTEAGCSGTADRGNVVKKDIVPVEVSLMGIGAKISEQLDQHFGAGTVGHIVRAETVGAKVGKQLQTDGMKALLYAMGFIFLYVMIRFDLRFAPGGIIALGHDAIIVVGAFALTGKEFNLQSIAAILTIIGYSINDTIVVFDRVRERVAMHRNDDIEEVTNKALNETLSRTILTSATTILSVVAVYILCTGAIQDFAFALLVGLVVGTYSSIFIASPIFLWVNKRFYGGKGHLQWVEAEGGEGTGKLLDPAPAGEDGGPPEADEGEGEGEREDDDEPDVSPGEVPGEPRRTARRRRRRPE